MQYGGTHTESYVINPSVLHIDHFPLPCMISDSVQSNDIRFELSLFDADTVFTERQ